MQAVGERQFLAGSTLAASRKIGSSARRVSAPARVGVVVNRAGGAGKVKPGTKSTKPGTAKVKLGTKSTKPGTQSTKPGTAKKTAAKVGGAASSNKPFKELVANENVTSTLSLGALFGATLAVSGYLVTASVQNTAVVPSAPAAPESVGIAQIVDRKVAIPEPSERKVITSKGSVKFEEPKVVVPPPVEAPVVKPVVEAPPPPAPKPAPKPVLQPSAAEKPPAPVTAAQLEAKAAKAPASSASKVAAPAADTADAPAISPAVLGGGVAVLALVGGAVAMGGGNMGEGAAAASSAPATPSAAAAGGAQPSAKEWIANWRSKNGGAAPAATAGGEAPLEERKKQVQAWVAKYKARS